MAIRILLVDDDADFRWAAGNVLRKAEYETLEAENGQAALQLLRREVPDLILLDYRMPGANGLDVAARILKIAPGIPIIMLTAYGEVRSAVSALKLGVYDYATKPLDNNDLLFTIQRALQNRDLAREVTHLRNILTERVSLFELMGNSDSIRKLVDLVEKVAPTSLTVLIEGESGVGKELVARTIHQLNASADDRRPFVAVDCGAIPETLIESELFGYIRGAFTGAVSDKPGQFELADGGSLFLDEVENLSYGAQQKLLRVLQERAVQRLGAKTQRTVNVRIIAAANRPLESEIENGRFRADLYFRLQEFAIRVPPLRERTEDIPYLANRFMQEARAELTKNSGPLSAEAIQALISYTWPGNVRELRNAIRQAVLLAENECPIKPEHFSFAADSVPFKRGITASPELQEVWAGKISLKAIVRTATRELESKIIRETLTRFNGNKSETARRLGVDYKTLLRKINRL
jgi:DNA-binding NtrC family response regulator